MPEIKISVIVPAFIRNQTDADYLKQCLESIERQTVKPFEIILVDDGSPFVYINQIKAPVKYIGLEDNSGIGNARKVGIEKSSGDYIAFCSSDDVWSLDKLKLHTELAEKYPDSIQYSDYLNIDEKGNVISQFRAPYHENSEQMILEIWSWTSRGDMFLNFSTILIPRKCFTEVPMNTLRESEDLDWILKACKYFKFRYITKPTVMYRRHTGMRTANRSPEELSDTARHIMEDNRKEWL